MFTVDNKFEVGEECYSVYRKPITYKCPICEGNGFFEHKGYKVPCSNCNQTGVLKDLSHRVLDVCKVRINKVVASLDNIGSVCIKYRTKQFGNIDYNVRNRNENTLFKTKEEAENYCKEVNTKAAIGEF